MGIVQTPQHFFSADPIQTNLLCASAWPNKQRFFFRNRHVCQGCVGRRLLLRHLRRVSCRSSPRDARHGDGDRHRGHAHEFQDGGAWLPHDLPQSRSAWGSPRKGCTPISPSAPAGALAPFSRFTRAFAGRARLRPISRLSSFDGTFYWIFTFPFKILMLTAPVLYW